MVWRMLRQFRTGTGCGLMPGAAGRNMQFPTVRGIIMTCRFPLMRSYLDAVHRPDPLVGGVIEV